VERALLPGLGAALGFGIAFGYLFTPGPFALAAAGVAPVCDLVAVAAFFVGLSLHA